MDEVRAWNFSHGFEWAKLVGFSDFELFQLRQRWSEERDRELERRVKCLPLAMRNRILWDAAIENLITVKPSDITPSRGYIILPVRLEDQEEETNVLILPPLPQRAVEISWPWSCNFMFWLTDPAGDRGAKWLKMMVEEFGLPAEAQHAWAGPNAGSSVLRIKRHAAFWRELHEYRLIEAQKRISAMADWLTAHGLDGMVTYTPHAVFLDSPGNYDPELSTFIFAVQFRAEWHCLISNPSWLEPRLVFEPFHEAQKFVSSSEWDSQQEWFGSL